MKIHLTVLFAALVTTTVAAAEPRELQVLVKLDEGYDNDGKLFSPVWVSGRLRTEHSDPELSLVDGSAPVGVGYALEQAVVEPYTQD